MTNQRMVRFSVFLYVAFLLGSVTTQLNLRVPLRDIATHAFVSSIGWGAALILAIIVNAALNRTTNEITRT